MTAVVQPDLGPPPAHKYKDDPSDDSLRHLGSNHNPQHPQSLQQHPRPGGLLHQHNQRPDSPHQHTAGSLPPNPYSAASGLNSLSLQHPPPPQYPPVAQDSGYYASHAHPYPATTTAPYPSSGPPELMAAPAQMQRPYPPMFQATPQSNSPASVTSSHTHDQHGRSLYAQSPQIASQMYGYSQPYSPINPVHPAYNPQPPAPQHPLTTQPLMMPPQTAPIQHTVPSTHQPAITNSTMSNNSPRLKVDSISQQHTPAQNQRPPVPSSTLTSPNTTGPPLSAYNTHASHPAGTNTTNAAPGPIPATTPQLVRQDSNGVQWIAFEYSRDRVKMEYTIRCDVESVNVEALPADFKTENCVYPRACCSKEQYRGNRLVYETECNAVGWALAELNPPLRGKRGLIQRAVDSWRNSNQDPRLRSRRVRRMAKMNRRQANQPPNHQLGGNAPVPHLLTQNPAALTPNARPPSAPMTLAAPPLQHHAHDADGQAGNEEVSGSTDFSNGAHRPPYVPTSAKPPISDAHEPTPDFRAGQVYHGMLPYPATAHPPSGLGTPSMAPPLQGGGFDVIGRQSVTTATSQRHHADDSYETEDAPAKPGDKVLFGSLPVGKRRKFILVDDHQRGGRARVKVTLDRVNMNEIPDSYRLTNAVFPRAYYPVQMKGSPGHTVPDSRYLEDNDAEDNNDDDDDGYEFDNGNDPVTVGRTLVTVPSIEGLSMHVPQLSRNRHRKDKVINDFGYRMSWSQSRVFAGRHKFLQRSLDAYRNKMRGSMLTMGQEPESIASQFETRIGKRKFSTRRKKNDSSMSASRRDAEEVEA